MMHTRKYNKVIAGVLLIVIMLMAVLGGCAEPQASVPTTGSVPIPTTTQKVQPTTTPTVPTMPTDPTVTTSPTVPTVPTIPVGPTQPTDPVIPPASNPIPEKYRKNIYLMSKDSGYCEVMTGTAMVTVILISDPETPWDQAAIDKAKKSISNDEARLESDAASYGAEYDVSFTFLETTVPMTIDTVNNEHPWARAALENLGLQEAFDSEEYLEELYGVDSAPIAFVINTKGRAFARSFSRGAEGIEYLVLYSSELNAFRHELSHIYGAMDFYYPFEVRELAELHLTNSLMIISATGVVDPFTAYLIGWTDEILPKAADFLDATNHITMQEFMEAHEADSRTGYGTKPIGDGSYTGWMIRGVPHGEGTLTSKNGDVYSGNWVNGAKQGQGTQTWANGNTYTGEWHSNLRHGRGEMYTASTGEKYIGEFASNQRKGYGTCFYENGDMYMGNWSNNKRHGQGQMLYINGDVYTGNYSYGAMSGQGTMEWADGSSYTGNWKSSKPDGLGEKIDASGERYVGEFKSGARHGTGTCYYVNGDIYAGTWESGQKNGQGEMTFANGDVYKGVFSYGMITGQGEMTYANGDRYVGEFVNGKRHGQGTCYYKDGTEFTGTWENDAPVQ